MGNTIEAILNELRKRTPESGKCWEESQNFIPGGLMSAARMMEPYPVYVERAKGAYIWDIDGNRYIDCVCSFGVHLLGHAPDPVLTAMGKQYELGICYGTPHTHEIDFSKRFVKCVPCAETGMVCNSGTEATLLAWRLMRAATGKSKIAKFEGCYHGWHDYAQWSVEIEPDDMGPADRPNINPDTSGLPGEIKDTMLILPFNDSAFDLIEENADELAGIAIEPVIGDGMLPVDKAFLAKLREVTKKHGILLHFDEVITGFRLALGGYQEITGILPDLATYGKIIGGGLPIGAVACSKELVELAQNTDNGWAAAGTFSGNPMTLSTGAATLKYLQENTHIYEDMMKKGEFLRNGFNDYVKSKGYPFCMTGLGSMFQIHAQAELPVVPRDKIDQDWESLKKLHLQFRLNNILMPWMYLAFFGAAHIQADIEELLNIFKDSAHSAINMSM